MSTQQTESSPMTATERNTLIRITKQRFKLLNQGIGARTAMLRREIHDEVVAEHADAVEKARRRVAKIRAKMEAVYDEYIDAVTDEYDTNGLGVAGYGGAPKRTLRSFSDGPGQHLYADFMPRDLTKEVEARLAKRLGDRPLSQYALEVEEARILEEILVGNLQTGESKRFLDEIPTLESLVPLTSGDAQKQIEA